MWHTIPDGTLEVCLANVAAQLPADVVHDARHLVRWCLKGRMGQRPTIEQILGHRFFTRSGPPPRPRLPMQYAAFISHAQADAAGTASTLHLLHEQLGLHCWLDMRQKKLTLEGMREVSTRILGRRTAPSPTFPYSRPASRVVLPPSSEY